MLLLKQFNQRFSVRKTDEFGKPRIIPLERLQIPRGSVFHTIDLDQVVLAPSVTTPYFQELEKPAQVRHHFQLPEDGISGRPIKVPVQGQERQILAYHRANRRFRRLSISDELVRKDPKVLLIENYTPMLPHYRYPDTMLSWYDRLRNVQVTMTNQLRYDSAEYLRQNYMIINIGSTLPAFDKFKNTYKDRVKTKLERFQSFELLWLLELFGWAYGDQNATLFAGFDMTQLSRTNFIFTHNSGFTVMNMGLVEKMRKSSGGRLSDEQMARNFYRTLVRVMTTQPDVSADIELEDAEGEVEVISQPEPQDDMVDGADAALDDDVVNEDDVPDDFDAKEDLVIDAPKEDTKPTTIVVEKVIDHGAVIKQEVEKLAEAGRVSAKAYKFLNDATERFNAMPNPYNPKETYGEAIKLTAKDTEIKPALTVREPVVTTTDWTQSSVDAITAKYNKEILSKDILSAVASAQRLGLAIHSHTVEKQISATGGIENHTVRLQSIGGEPVTVRFQTPALTEDGTWVANGTEYTMRRQRVDLPIRKIDYETVALTTAYGKNFVRRSDKVVNDYGRWLTNAIIVRAVDPKDTTITDAKLANVFDPLSTLPRQYTMVSRRISTFNAISYTWNFDVKAQAEFFGEDAVKSMAKKELVPVAKGRGGVMLGMDDHSQMYKVNGDKIEPQGTLSDVLGIDQSKTPREMTELSLMGKALSLGFIFSFYLGLTGMMRHFGIRYEVLPPGQRIDKTIYDSVFRLSDAKIVAMCDNDKQRMILHGMDKYIKYLTTYTESEVDREDIYLNLIRDADGLTPRYINELRLMRTAFVDDMHARILRKMGEPETFIGLLERSNEMLQNDYTKPEINGDEMMFIGNQRIAYHVYTALVRAQRNYLNAPGSNRRFELSQDMVWGAINSDPSVLLAPGANPIQSIKEKDVVTMGGTGGRNRKTMVYHTREFPESDLGIVSGNTVDNGDVGITAFLTNNPRFDSVDGTTVRVDDMKPGQMLSFIDGLAPDTLMDDAKRQNFVGIQWGSATTCIGATVAPYRTEQEKMVAHRTSVKHARVIQKPAKVTAVTEDYVRVQYEDKTEETFPLGRWFGAHEGSYYPHTLVTKWKAGEKLPAGTVVTYNEQHFEPDLLDPTQVNLKAAIMANVALIESEEVIEDSNAISERFAAKAQSDVTKVKEVTIASTQNLLALVKVGDHVDVDSILCTFSDNLSDDMSGFSAEAAATLQELSAFSPQAGVRGHIDKIEVVYHGDPEDFTPTLQTLINQHDRQRRKLANAIGGDIPTSGSVNGDYRVEGVPLAYNNLVIRFYITHRVEMAAADKMVIANQLKTTVQEVMRGINRTENGEDVDIIFGRNSCDARIVGSLMRIGTTNAASIRGGSMLGKILDGESVPALPTKV